MPAMDNIIYALLQSGYFKKTNQKLTKYINSMEKYSNNDWVD